MHNYKYMRLIGYLLDTNQKTTPIIENYGDAKFYIDMVRSIYGMEIFQQMFLEGNRFTAFKRDGLSLHEFLTR